MAANNQVVLIGRAGNNVAEDTRHLQSGSIVAEVRLAVNRPGKDQAGNTQTDWITCQFWSKQAEILKEYVKKGDLISVSGSMRVDNWETPEGEKRSKVYVHGENFQMLESRRAKEERMASEGGGGYSGGGSSNSNYSRSSAPAPQAAPMAPAAAPMAAAPAASARLVDDFSDEFMDDELPPF